MHASGWSISTSSSWGACTLVASSRKVERSARGGLCFLLFRYFALETTMSTPGHIHHHRG